MRSSPTHHRPARYRPRSVRYVETPGSNDHNDPVWLLENITLDEIERILSVLVPIAIADSSDQSQDKAFFSEWEIKFVQTVNASYSEKHARGFHDRPLSGKQLFWLWKLYERVAKDSEQMITETP